MAKKIEDIYIPKNIKHWKYSKLYRRYMCTYTPKKPRIIDLKKQNAILS